MEYKDIVEGIFEERPNRFVAKVWVGGQLETVHVKNTGRCKELLVKGNTVYMEDYGNRMGSRKLRYSLIAVRKGSLLINMDSQAPNRVVKEALSAGTLKLPGTGKITLIRPEKKYGDSRFDFYVEDVKGSKAYVEVKGVTLEKDGVCAFPDAPTERGVKHLNELVSAKSEGYGAYVIFVIQMQGMKYMKPNDETHKAFGDALRNALSKGVIAIACICTVTESTLEITGEIEIKVNKE